MQPKTELPVDAVLESLVASLQQSSCAVLEAPTGAGKTTRVPPALASRLGLDGRVVVLEPRRLAARAAAQRMAQEGGTAQEGGWSLGREVGYQVRFERRWSAASRIVVVTEGILVQWLQDDPFLEGVGCVVFDEIHERSLFADLALAMVRRIQRDARPDLRLVAMSATLDGERLASYLGETSAPAPVVRSAGRLFPVEVEYLQREDQRPLAVHVSAKVLAVRQTLAREGRLGAVLAFLPGVGEIQAVAERLRREAPQLDVQRLYGDLPLERQAAALRGDPERVVLATNVAETSVTVEGVVAVVDSGWERRLELDASSGLDRLRLVRCSRASAEQRAGRAGRVAPGRCCRLWTAAAHSALVERTPPEVVRADLARAVLQLRAWGERPEAVEWLDAPPASALASADALLRDLGACEGGERGRSGVTALGREMARLPLHPRLARLVLEGRRRGVLGEAALVAALLSERDISERRSNEELEALADADSDLLERWRALRSGAADGEYGRLNRGRARRVRRVADQIRSAVREEGEEEAGGASSSTLEEALGRAILAAYPDRVARRVGDRDRRALMVGGRGVRFHSASQVRSAPLVVCLEVAGSGARSDVYSASAIEEPWLDPAQVRNVAELVFDEQRRCVVETQQRLYRDLVLAESRTGRPRGAAVSALLAREARERLEEALDLQDVAVRALRARVACLREWCPELELPACDENDLRTIVGGMAEGRTSFAELRAEPLAPLLRGLMSWRQQRALDELAPERLRLPNGRSAAIEYRPGEPPVLPARIQDLFGWTETPRIAGGRVTLLLHLLAPNHRPQQITDDLGGFWRRTYPEVRKELAGRYPKHRWPEDPMALG